MSRPQKMHAPLPFTLKEVLTAIASGHGVEKPTTKKPRKEISKRSAAKKSK
jgi:hypothetical protein